tara:strand:- start:17 stop:349 length:333 start_codon:yes stop_codon:yes gene_type:complete
MSGLIEHSADARSKTIGQNFRCRAWVNFNGSGTIAIVGSGNVSSITDTNVGNYTVNFTQSMPDANFAVSYTASGTDPFMTSLSTTSTSMQCRNSSDTNVDPSKNLVVVFR